VRSCRVRSGEVMLGKVRYGVVRRGEVGHNGLLRWCQVRYGEER
jgi:hypothetical protein